MHPSRRPHKSAAVIAVIANMKLSGQQQQVIDLVAGAVIAGHHYCPVSGMMWCSMRALVRMGLIDYVMWGKVSMRYEVTKKGRAYVKTPYWQGPVVSSDEIAPVKMAAGNELRYPRVIDNDRVKTWVGAEWIDDGEPTIGQRNTLPRVIRL